MFLSPLFWSEPVIDNANTAATATVVENENIEKGELQEVREMQLDGGFVLPESNALGHSFRFNAQFQFDS